MSNPYADLAEIPPIYLYYRTSASGLADNDRLVQLLVSYVWETLLVVVVDPRLSDLVYFGFWY